jgi:hypothetical protein
LLSNGPAKILDATMEKSSKILAAYKENKLTVDEANAIYAKHGYKDALLSDELWKLSGAKSYQGATQKLVSDSRMILQTAILRVGEFANVATQLLGQSVLLLPQTKTLAMAYGADEAVGKMVYNGIRSAHTKDSPITKLFEEAGFLQKSDNAFMEILQETSSFISNKETKSAIGSGLKAAIDLVSKPVDWMERFTRNTALHTAALAVEGQGIVRGTSEWYAATLNFANKVNGNFVASQRPTVFSGVTGQVLTLFQSYQVNLMQQMFSHLGRGEGTQLAMMAAAQNTMFGLS